MTRFIEFTEALLVKQHLSVLREIGRVIGVKAPAGKKKEVLIEEIIAIQKGELTPEEQSKRGAPPKMTIDISQFIIDGKEDPNEKIGIYSGKTIAAVEDSGVAVKEEKKEKEEIEEEAIIVEGVLEQHSSGYGFLRVNNYENSHEDAYVSIQNIKKFNLRRGDLVKGFARHVQNVSSAALYDVVAINGMSPERFLRRKNFDDLIPYYPTERIKLETPDSNDIAIRCIDLFAPLGKGQRGLIVAPPKTGKTTLLKKIAQSIEKNHPEIKLIILLIDERPEEVTDIKRSVNAEVVFSTFDENAEHHVRAAELVINRAKRLVEVGADVVILMDSITRLARAYNNTVESSGKILSGGLDPSALLGPKRFFGAARNIEDGGSLTILSTALIDTGSRMDDVIFEEFKGTGNMEIHLSRELSEKRIFPAIDLYKSGTRKEELLLTEKELSTVYKLRKILADSEDATDSLLEMLKKSKSNDDLMNKLDTWLKLYEK
ncbi:MAG: transcription termination factor Rho [Clostridia bacterium]|nr:transcription termination factor Rho [Clostridia bacterium]